MDSQQFKALIQSLKSNNDIVDVIDRYIGLKKKGTEYAGKCPWHQDSKPSLAVNRTKQVFTCPVCGDRSGDVIDFLKHMGHDWGEIIDILGGNDVDIKQVEKRVYEKEKPEWNWNPEATGVPSPINISHPIHGTPSQTWFYKNKHGEVVSVDCRFEINSGKIVLPFTFLFNSKDGHGEWRWAAMGEGRIPYGLHEAIKNPDKTLLISEGCKTAKFIADKVSSVVSITWQGGSNAISKTDWSILKGRRVIFWPDFDWAHKYGERHELSGELMPWDKQPGNKAAMYIHENFAKDCVDFMFVHNPVDKPSGWDAADSGWSPEETLRYIRENIFEEPQKYNPNESYSKDREYEFRDLRSGATQNETDDRPGDKDPQPDPERQLLVQSDREDKKFQDIPENNVKPNLEVYENSDVEANKAIASQSNTKGEVATKERPKKDKRFQNRYFKFVGYMNNEGKLIHCYYSFVTKTIIKLSSSNMGKGSSLFDLAPLSFWEASFPGEKSNFDGPAAVDWLVTTSKLAGMFKDDFIRGRGAWIDDDRVVIHSGDKLFVDGKEVRLEDFDSDYVYEQGKALGFDASSEVTSQEAKDFMELLKMFSWERDINAHLLAGWCVVAPMCGALSWRPHIWITGPAGSGKSWIFMNIVRFLIGKMGLFVQGSTTEAGLRQTLKKDAIPVIFDEAEGESHQDQVRMQSVLNFMRASSSEDGGFMLKGSQGGAAVAYNPKSCFAYASIGLQLNQQSDKTRVSILSLTSMGTKDSGRDQFKKVVEEKKRIMTRNFDSRLQARTVRLLPVIIKNASVFAEAGAVILGGQRMGDQIGFLLAGAYSLVSEGEITYEQALKWIEGKDWNEEMSLKESRDELRLFQRIMEQEVQAEGDVGAGKFTRTVGELARIWAGLDEDPHIMPMAAEKTLLRCGIRINDDGSEMTISNSSKWIKSSLRDTPWANNHAQILSRIEGVRKTDKPVRFASISQRGVIIPMEFFLRFGFDTTYR